MWLQQLEITKTGEYNMQKKITFLVKQNRALQFEIENLCRSCEKLAVKSNQYPKRFLKARSFGKNYARHLIDNNRRLQNKVKTLTEVISNFENELQKIQDQNDFLDTEKRSFKSKLYNIEGVFCNN